MNKILEEYLSTLDKNLKPLPTSERIDIVKEVKGSILEMENDNLTIEQILDRLGKPKELAKAYLGDLISKQTGFSWNRFLIVCAFYSLTGFSGMFIIPICAVLAPSLIFCGVIAPIAGLIKFVASLFGYDMPYVIFQFGSITLHPGLGFLYSIVMGMLLILLGKGVWKLLLCYIKTVTEKKRDLSI